MERLRAWAIPETTSHLVFVEDACIPRDVKAFFRLNPSGGKGLAKIRLKDKKGVLSTHDRQRILGLMDDIAKRNYWNFDSILEEAKKQKARRW
jgi:hypothetical protein